MILTFKKVLAPFLLSRLLILSILLISASSGISTVPAREGHTIHLNLNTTQQTETKLKHILLSADASWYSEIAQYGYPTKHHTTNDPAHWVFFPGFPILMHLANKISSSYIINAIILNNIFFLLGLMLLFRLSEQYFSTSEQSQNIIYLLCFHPLSYFFFTPHTESLFFVSLIGTIYFASKKTEDSSLENICLTTILLSVCLLSRPTGLLILPGVLFFLWSRGYSLVKISSIIGIALLPLFAFFYYLYKISGSPLAWLTNQEAWGRTIGGSSLFEKFMLIFRETTLVAPWNFNLLHIIIIALTLISSYYLFKKKLFSFLLILLLPLLASLGTGSIMSISRIMMPVFPFYIGINLALNKTAYICFILCSAILLGILCLLYSLHVSMAMA